MNSAYSLRNRLQVLAEEEKAHQRREFELCREQNAAHDALRAQQDDLLPPLWHLLRAVGDLLGWVPVSQEGYAESIRAAFHRASLQDLQAMLRGELAGAEAVLAGMEGEIERMSLAEREACSAIARCREEEERLRAELRRRKIERPRRSSAARTKELWKRCVGLGKQARGAGKALREELALLDRLIQVRDGRAAALRRLHLQRDAEARQRKRIAAKTYRVLCTNVVQGEVGAERDVTAPLLSGEVQRLRGRGQYFRRAWRSSVWDVPRAKRILSASQAQVDAQSEVVRKALGVLEALLSEHAAALAEFKTAESGGA